VRARAYRLLVVLLLLGSVACDQTTKHVATRALEGGRVVTLVPGLFDLRLVHNPGIAFSLLNGFGAAALVGVAIAVLALLAVTWWRMRHRGALVQAALALVAGGALANLWDRIARGAVVDFMHLAHWPVFNVADVAIVAGAMLLAIAGRSAHAP
jgi:signal peptidase II